MGKIALVTGGARSGKSAFAERLAAGRGERVVYVATAEALDAEMEQRIRRHQERRPSSWTTREAPHDLLGAISDLPADVAIVLVDCLSLWVSNRLLALGEMESDEWWNRLTALEKTLCREITELSREARRSDWALVLVTNEVGSGIVPSTRLGRAFRDLLGRVNQAAGAEAESVFLVVAGVGVDLKPLAAATGGWK